MPMDRAIDIDELWRIAARKLRVPSRPPQDVYVEGLRCLASALQSKGRYDADALRALQREVVSRILADLNFSNDLSRYPGIAEVPARRPLLVAGFGRTAAPCSTICWRWTRTRARRCCGSCGPRHPRRAPRPRQPIRGSKSPNVGSIPSPRPTHRSSGSIRWPRVRPTSATG